MSPRSYPEPRRTKPPTLGDVARGQHEPPHSQPPSWQGKADPHWFAEPEQRQPRIDWTVVGWWAAAFAISCLFWALLFVAYVVGTR